MCHSDEDVVVAAEGAEQEIELPGSGRTIPTYAYGYTRGEKKPAVVILHDIRGAGQFYRDMGKRLAQAGFAAFLPDLFCREGAVTSPSHEAVFARASKHSFPVAVKDIQAITDALNDEGRNVGVIGFCMGGTLALLVASRMPRVKAAVVYYGFPVNTRPAPNRPENPIDEVEQLQVPLLGFFGGQDQAVGPENVQLYEEAARKTGKQLDFTMYPNVGHGFLSFDPEAASAQESQESWQRALAFFKEKLG